MKKRKNQLPEIIGNGLKHQSTGSIARLLIAVLLSEILYRLFGVARVVGFAFCFVLVMAIKMAHYAYKIKKWDVPLGETLFYRYLWARLPLLAFAVLLILLLSPGILSVHPIVFWIYLFGSLLFFVLTRLFQKRLYDENVVLLLRHYSDYSLLRAKRLSEIVSNIATIHVISEPEYNYMEMVEKLHNPVGINFIATQDEWRDTVINKCRQAIAIIIDVEKETPSPNVQWEIEQTGKLFPSKTVLIAPLNITLEWKAKLAPATELIKYDVESPSENMKRDLLAFILKSKRRYDRKAIQQN